MPLPVTTANIKGFRDIINRASNGSVGSGVSLIDPAVTDAWASAARHSGTQNAYIDYYFSGQDIDVRLSGDTDPSPMGQLPIMELAIQIEQEKLPLYGFWSYTFDHVLRGVRVVSGAFTVATTYPGYMNDLVAKAASIRKESAIAQTKSYPYHQELTEDDKNIDLYWGSNLDPSYDAGNKNLFSVHPPFSLTLTYGIQSLSVDTNGQLPNVANFLKDYYDNQDNVLMSDENQRLVPSSPSGINRLFIDDIELKSCQRSFTSDGSICVETYTFIARDIVTPNVTQ